MLGAFDCEGSCQLWIRVSTASHLTLELIKPPGLILLLDGEIQRSCRKLIAGSNYVCVHIAQHDLWSSKHGLDAGRVGVDPYRDDFNAA